jgi:hypothetical protein
MVIRMIFTKHIINHAWILCENKMLITRQCGRIGSREPFHIFANPLYGMPGRIKRPGYGLNFCKSFRPMVYLFSFIHPPNLVLSIFTGNIYCLIRQITGLFFSIRSHETCLSIIYYYFSKLQFSLSNGKFSVGRA